MFKQICVAAILVAGATGGAFAQTRTINVWGAQLDVPTYGAPAPSVTSNMQPASRFDRDSATYTSMKTSGAQGGHHTR
ncbi:hypothetical protein [Methylobacterium gnaphalii]|uniref:Uncharacterized protein n=1 Tax=Methylobacterium gnaphalii TaxID=1010610 RepID=A0A512JM19_9HYPH|nr:hypothetical protein [Methylobacterium gnaphalii]GEP10903.1 hypothetical protein MGN01_27480 [Methylobacterium gnaphalii]GJD68544.1 hypothetical protein MMMDOFMJ_1467 [Methylobacterium gnaphalii]GLS50651.1 hypothetical protein GCM10007885_35050 [Methylobacterium gnaphalii]